MKTILLYAAYTDQMSYYDDWTDAFLEHKNFHTEAINVCGQTCDFKLVTKRLETAELVVLHHSMNGDTLEYLKPFISPLKNRRGKLVSFVGNEVNLPTMSMKEKIKSLKDLDVDIIATQLLQEAGDWLYSDCSKSKIISIPHGLNPAIFSPDRSIKRKIDIGTRSARYGVYIGDNDRNQIIQFFHKNAKQYNFSIDLGLEPGQQKRFNRAEWKHFLNSSVATLSTEAGSFYLEKGDAIVHLILKYLKKKSDKIVLPNEDILRKYYRSIVPSPIRKKVINLLGGNIIESANIDESIDFEGIYEKFFLNAQKCPVYSKAISSRHFDAIGTKTLHIMYPGRYNDILIPGEHYFELAKDHSNILDLKDLLENKQEVNNIVDRTYDYILSKHTHKHRLDAILQALF
ncbi:MAG TPA: hypothetical protein DD412_00925 [Holosporales bacterium]|nr:hypothetical protein [Holosporales bacterium]